MTLKQEPLRTGQRFVKYEIRGLLGAGGHAHVYAAYDPFLDREVAVKVIASPKGSRHNMAKRAQSEARVLVRIDHPNVVKVYDAGATDDGLVYLVMEKLEGRSLREVYRELGRISMVEALEIGKQICAGVHAAHELDVIHRDLKPENVFVQSDNRVKVLDFGISKVMGYGAHETTQRHVLHGTVLYMSPEHLQGYGVTCKSDVFALGTLLYEGLYAHPTLLWPEAREARDVRDVIHVQLAEMPPMLHELDPRIFRHVARFVQRAILKAGEQRYASMAEMLEAAHASWERIAHEQGPDYLVQWRRDLSRAARTPPNQQAQRDTVQAAMRFSTDIPPVRRPTERGGLTAPAPLTSTMRLEDPSQLPYQTTTAVASDHAGSFSPSSRPAVVVPPVQAPASSGGGYGFVPVPGPVPHLTPSAPPPTAAQAATLALAEQVTRTAALELGQASPATVRSEGAPSVVPLSTLYSASMSLRAEGVPEPWRSRLSIRIFMAAAAILGVAAGVGYGVLGKGAAQESSDSDSTILASEADSKAKAPVERDASDATPIAGRVAEVHDGPAPVPAGSPTMGQGVAKAEEPARTADAPRASDATAARPAPSAGKASKKNAPSAELTPAASEKPRKSKAAATDEGETVDQEDGEHWLKPHMIHYPDDSAPAPSLPRKKPEPDMPASGLD